jgi:hypothetical protein
VSQFPNLPPSTTTGPRTEGGSQVPESKRGHLNAGIIVGIVVGTCGFMVCVDVFCLYQRGKLLCVAASSQKGSDSASKAESDSAGDELVAQHKSFGEWFRETFMETKVTGRSQ